jgi:glutamyl-tRNA reductase
MHDIAPEIVSIADACFGGLQGRSVLLIGPKERRSPYAQLLRQQRVKYIYEEDTPMHISYLLPYVQLLISVPESGNAPMLTAANIAKGCTGRNRPLLIFDLASSTSVEELVGLLPTVCLYTPEDIRRILDKTAAKAS